MNNSLVSLYIIYFIGFCVVYTDSLNEGPNLQAVTEVLFDNCEDYQNIQNNKNSSIWRPY